MTMPRSRTRALSLWGRVGPGLLCSLWLLGGCLLQEWEGEYVEPDTRGELDPTLDTGMGTDDAGDDNVSVSPDLVSPKLGAFHEAIFIHRGAESIVVGGEYGTDLVPGTMLQRHRHGVRDFALSGDGSRVWLLAHDPQSRVGAEDALEVWSVDTAGGSALQSRFVAPEGAELLAHARIYTGAAGERALLAVPYLHAEGSSAARDHRDYAIYRAPRPGRMFEKVADTGDIDGFADLRIDMVSESAAAADLQSLLIHDGRTIWRVAEAAGWAATPVFDAMAWSLGTGGEGSRLSLLGLDVSHDGSSWIASIYDPPRPAPFVIVSSSGDGSVHVEQSHRRVLGSSLELDGAGESFVYTLAEPDASRPVAMLGHHQITPRAITTDVDTSLDIALSGNGRRMYVVHGIERNGGLHSGYVDTTAVTPERVRAHSDALVGPAARRVALDDDATVMAAATTIGRVDGQPRFGLWVAHLDDPGVHGPVEFIAARYAYDSAGDLTVRVDLRADVGPVDLYVMPLYQGYVDPAVLAPPAQNPLAAATAAALGLRSTAADGLETHEVAIPLQGKAALLAEGDYALRIVATLGASDSPVHQVSFIDFALEFGGL